MYEVGKRLFFMRGGTHDFSCASCHGEEGKRIRLQECLISTGFPFRPDDDYATYLKLMSEVMKRTAGLRRPGAAALDLAYVAAGFCDGFFGVYII